MTLHCRRCQQDRPESDFTPSMTRRPDRWCKPCTNQYRRDIRAGHLTANRRVEDACPACGADLTGRPTNVIYCSEECRVALKQRVSPVDEVAKWLNRAYGMTVSEKARLLDEQGGKCAICKTTETRAWHVDHCHETGAIRGILCAPCNLGLGQFMDDPARLRAAARYLARSGWRAQKNP